ncbi:hypothetical protein GGS23DRAFT_353732 [Durotheca rogersii]|uniref:uncharacterized protein n=1 Tax=Durotheca rogersii TaxID=419775 RepID=UPI00221EB165|nr:uncharacterized protein GGS23DRAFT_353732 [Durotheca rogersii]KAI5865759.1 hypothetical protein GGS23DRAFT_353732 [Durotheca rogersii]
MSPFNGGRQILSNARSKLGHSRRLSGMIKRLSMMRLKSHSGDEDSNEAVDNDDQSSIDNPLSPTEAGTSMSSDVMDPEADAAKNAVVVSSSERRPRQNVSGLLLLPQELFDAITSHLSHAQIIVLALVNKELMARFMRSAAILELTPPDEPSSYKALNAFIKKADSSKTKIRGSLLSSLDYDLQDLVYCYKCKKLHDPFVTFKDRAFAPNKAIRCMDWAPEHHMPPRATRKLLRSITKRRNHGAEYRHLLQQVNNTTTLYQTRIMVQVSLRARYRNDDLLMRRQQIVSSIDKTALALWLFGKQVTEPFPASLSLPKVYRMCNHLCWDFVYAPLLTQWIDPLCQADHGDEVNPFHTPTCFRTDPHDVSKQEGHMIAERLRWLSSGAKWNPMDVPTLLGDVLGCDKCTTDFSLDVTPLPEPFGWGFVLTSWLDLGNCDFCPKWDSHRDARPSRNYARKDVHGDICRRFEDIETSRLDHRVRISELDHARMKNYGWAERAAEGADTNITWSSGHYCDPVTGMIKDPDPLEDADC